MPEIKQKRPLQNPISRIMIFLKVIFKNYDFQMKAYWTKPESIAYISSDFSLRNNGKESSKPGGELG